MNFSDSEIYLNSLGNEVLAMKLGLDNIRKLLKALGNPEENYLKVQVAGTNGKGSVCAFLDSICREAGIAVGVFTSPHLVSITERVRINGLDISEDEFARIATIVRDTSEKLVSDGKLETVPTFFEQVTAIALVAFAEAKVELGILETGLGGRYDAVTAANAEIAAITRIDLDHQEYLGDTIEKIAGEKAGIIHKGSHVVIAPQRKSARSVIDGRCREMGVEPRFVEVNVKSSRRPDDYSYNAVFNTGRIQIRSANRIFQDVELGLWGKHQWENATVAIEIAELLCNSGYQIDNTQIREGLQRTRHAGRLEFVGHYLLDGAHNVGGATALAEYLREFIHQPITLVFGAMNDKDVAQITEILFPLATTIILTKPANSRAIETAELRKLIPAHFAPEEVLVADSVEDALKIAPYHCLSGLMLVTGSLYLVGEAKRILRSQI